MEIIFFILNFQLQKENIKLISNSIVLQINIDMDKSQKLSFSKSGILCIIGQSLI